MKIQDGQHKDILKKFPNYNRYNSSIIAEGGNDKGTTFYGRFMVDIDSKHHVFEDGEYVKQID